MSRKDNTSRSRKSGRKAKSVKTKPAAPAPMPGTNNGPAPVAVLSPERLQQLYSSMLKCRILQERVQEISAIGQSTLQENTARREAVLAGTLAHARREDSITSAENVFLTSFLCGDLLNSLLMQLFSNAAQPASNNKKISPAHLALARGMGQAKEMFDSGRVALVFCGEDPAALAFQTEALALAAKYKAPVVCLIETSLSSLETTRDRERTKTRKPPQHHFPEIVVDGV